MTEGDDTAQGSSPRDPNKRYCKNCGKELPTSAPLTRKYCDNDGVCRSDYIQRSIEKRRQADHIKDIKSGHNN